MTTALLTIDKPGVFDGLPESVYLGDPVPGGSLSASGAKKLLPPSCPAKFAWERDNPPPPRADFDFGSAAHKLVLGAGPEIAVIKAANWTTKAARQERDDARAAGLVPMLERDHERVQAMAAEIRRHPTAAALFNPELGRPEQSLFWVDEESGVWCRARFDFLRDRARGRFVIPDYKTTDSADLESIRRSVYRYSYYQQCDWYRNAAVNLGLSDEPLFVFVFQEKDPPHLITIVDLEDDAVEAGREDNRKAIGIFRRCTETGHWPGYSEDIAHVNLPAWARRTPEEF